MYALFIINPVSGSGKAQNAALSAMQMLLKDGTLSQADVFYTRGKDDAYNKALTAQETGYDFVVAVGGDGTINEAVLGLYKSNSTIPLAILPAGTSNDFAYSVGIKPTAPCLYNMVKSFIYKTIDIASFNDSYFLNVAAGGMLSDVAHSVTRDTKTKYGMVGYYTVGLKKLAHINWPTTKLIFTIDGKETEVHDNFFFFVSNSKSVGGFHKIAPKATLDDGYLDLYIVDKINIVQAAGVAVRVLNGSLEENVHAEYHRVKELYVRPAEEIDEYHVDYDGENGGGLPLHVKVIPKAVNLLIPTNVKRTEKMFTPQGQDQNQ